MSKISILRSGISGVLVMLWIHVGIAQITQWDGGGDNVSWHDPLNWDFNVVPTKNLHVVINATGNVVIDNSVDTAFAASLDIQSASKFVIDPGAVLHIDAQNTAQIEDGMRIDGSLNSAANNGTLIIKNAKENGLWVGSTIFQNTGILQINSYANNDIFFVGFRCNTNSNILNEGEIRIRNNNTSQTSDGVFNHGSFVNSSAGIIEINNMQGLASEGIFNSDIFINTGTIIIDSIGSSHGIANSLSGEFRNFGTITITNTGKVEIINQAEAKVSGNGIINGSIVNKAVISPGTSIGQLTINGDLEMDTDAKFVLEIEGDAGPGLSGGHDQIVVNGDVILSDTLKVDLLGGFVPADQKNYDFIKYSGNLSGSFLTNVIKPPSLIGWSWYNTLPGHILFRRYCGGDMVIENCTDPSCTLYSAYIDAENQIQFNGPFTIPLGEQVLFQSQEMVITDGFNVDLGAVFEMNPGPCGT